MQPNAIPATREFVLPKNKAKQIKVNDNKLRQQADIHTFKKLPWKFLI